MVKAFAQTSSDRCIVRFLDLYLSKLPGNPRAFYLQWVTDIPDDPQKPWYKTTPVGVNPLKSMVPTICRMAGLNTRYTNHSLCATAATRMFSSGIPEKVIAEVTGHKSTKSLRQYEKTSVEQEQAAGMAIQSCESKPSVSDLNTPTVRRENGSENESQAIEEKAAAIAKKVLPTVHFPTVCLTSTSKLLSIYCCSYIYILAFNNLLMLVLYGIYCTLNAQLRMLYITRLRERAEPLIRPHKSQ